MTAGDIFGEIAALTGSPRTADVVAEDDTTLLEVPADSLRRLMAIPEFGQLVLGKMTERLARPRVSPTCRASAVSTRAPCASSGRSLRRRRARPAGRTSRHHDRARIAFRRTRRPRHRGRRAERDRFRGGSPPRAGRRPGGDRIDHGADSRSRRGARARRGSPRAGHVGDLMADGSAGRSSTRSSRPRAGVSTSSSTTPGWWPSARRRSRAAWLTWTRPSGTAALPETCEARSR